MLWGRSHTSCSVSIDAMWLNSTAEKYHHHIFFKHIALLHSILPSVYVPSHLAVWLRDVGYGVAYFQTCPVDGSCHSEESEDDEQHPWNVDSLRVLGWLPCTHLTAKTLWNPYNHGNLNMQRERYTHTKAHHKSCSGGSKNNEEQEAE